tara:strand:- start:3105 stop:3653 length:549 start_codon:yes stop_codon:yes gene_type:complete
MLFCDFATFVYENIMKKIQYDSCLEGVRLGWILIFLTSLFYIYDTFSLLPEMNLYSLMVMGTLLIYSLYVLMKFYTKYHIVQYNFKIYFSISFLLLAMALFLLRIYIIILYNVIDPNLIDEYVSYLNDNRDFDFKGFVSRDWLDLVQRHFSFFGQMQSYVFSLIPCTLYAAIISLLMKLKHK